MRPAPTNPKKVRISPWLLICTFLLSLFIALGKRHNEITILKGEAVSHRAVVRQYTISMLNHFLSITSAATIISYMLYTSSHHPDLNLPEYGLMPTIPFVVYGILRYNMLIHKGVLAGDPVSVVIHDRPLKLNVALWVVASILIIYVI